MNDSTTNKKFWHNPELLFLSFILVLAALLRFYNYSNLSITADGVSAIERTLFDSFGELIEKGVKPDFHPAFVQAMLFYWTKLFGITEASIRIPFIISGILAVLFSYLIASKWFGKIAGLFVASSICFLQFPLLYSQIERPYTTGLLFSLMTVFSWSNYLFNEQSNKRTALILYALSTALCMLNHYFSFLFAFIVGLTGFFFLTKQNGKGYILAGICAVALCIPHTGVYIHQLSKGGIGGPEGWLAPPESDFFWKFLFFCFNNSYWLLVLFVVIFLGSLVFFLRTEKNETLNSPKRKFRWICLLWFLLPFTIGYYYSNHVNPILQYSCLLFSFPFLIMFLFSFVSINVLNTRAVILLLLFISAGTYNTVLSKKYYSTNHFGVLKELAVAAVDWTKKLGDNNITKLANLDSPYFINYYFDRYNYHPSFTFYKIDKKEKLPDFNNMLDTCKAPYFMYAWSTTANPVELPEVIKEKYPFLVDRQFFYNSEFYLFSKNETDKSVSDVLYQAKTDFEKTTENFMDNDKTIVDSIAFSGHKSVMLNDTNNFSPVFKCRLNELLRSPDDIINVSLMAYLTEDDADAEIVITLESNDKGYYWVSSHLKFFVNKKNEWKKAFFSIRVPKLQRLDDHIKLYVWHPSGKTVYIDDLEVKITEGNSLIYGERTYFN